MPQGESKCRTCLKPIKWAKTEQGRNMPLDPDPVAGGNIELINGIAYVRGVSDNPADVRHVSHFATCPGAQHHRRRRK